MVQLLKAVSMLRLHADGVAQSCASCRCWSDWSGLKGRLCFQALHHGIVLISPIYLQFASLRILDKSSLDHAECVAQWASFFGTGNACPSGVCSISPAQRASMVRLVHAYGGGVNNLFIKALVAAAVFLESCLSPS